MLLNANAMLCLALLIVIFICYVGEIKNEKNII